MQTFKSNQSMKIYAVMYSADVQQGNYNDMYVVEDRHGNPCIGPGVFCTKEDAEEWIKLNPKNIQENFTVVELGVGSIEDFKG